MAYIEPTYKAKDDVPTAPLLQVYADNTDALVGDAVAFRNYADHGPDRSDAAREYFTFIHRGAWLIYATEPEDAAGNKKSAILFPYRKDTTIGADVTLPDAPDGGAFHVEQGVDWMVPGRKYQIDNVLYAFEISEFTT